MDSQSFALRNPNGQSAMDSLGPFFLWGGERAAFSCRRSLAVGKWALVVRISHQSGEGQGQRVCPEDGRRV